MKDYKIYLAGNFVKTNKKLSVVGPFSRKEEFTTYCAEKEDFEKATNSAIKVQKELFELPVYKKFEILKEISEKLKSKKEEIAKIISLESGKPLRYSLSEVDRAALTFLVAGEEAKRLPSEMMSIDWAPGGENKEAFIKYFPIGPVAAISPFNFPLNLVAHKVAPAIASACPIVLKPASQTPITALKLAEIIDQTSLPKGAISVIPMDRETGNNLVKDDRYKLLTFTGSPQVGWQMKKESGKKKVVLELGGNAGLILTKDVKDLEKVVKKSIIGAFSYSGQSCIHTQRIFIEEEIFDNFVKSFVSETKKLKYGNPLDKETDISSMIDKKNAIRIEEWVKEAVNNGANLLCGGKRKGTYYEATVLTDTKSDMKVCFDEVFAPIVIIEKFSNFQKAIEEINNSSFGLQAGIFTNDQRKINHAWKNLDVGGVVINDVPSFRMDHMPYGGVKDSGLGREGPKYAIRDMTEAKVLIIDNS